MTKKVFLINMNELPYKWDISPIVNISTVIMGQSPPSSTYNIDGEGLPFFQGKGEFGHLYPNVRKWCSKPSKIAKKNDVLISVRAPVGPTNLAPSDCCIGRGLAAIQPAEGIPSKYVLYYLRSIESEIESLGTGTTFKAISGPILRNLSIPIAPPNEQKRIVAEIEKQFFRLDEAVAALKRIKANLKRYKASVLKAAVEGKLTEEWRTRRGELPFAPTKDETGAELLKRILTERRKKWEEEYIKKYVGAHGHAPKDDKWKKKYKEPTVPKLDQYPHLPEGWAFTGIGQILAMDKDAMKTGPFGSLLKKHEHQPEGVPVLGIENIQAMRFVKGSKIHITKNKAQQLDGYCALPGDVLISRSGTVGEVCVVPSDIDEARISTNLMKISLAKDGLLPELFTFLFNGSPFVLNQVAELCKGSTRNFLNQEILKRIVFVLPTIEEQIEIIQAVDRQYTLLSKLEAEVNINLKRTERLRQSILKKAFSGKLVKQDTDDKPTNKLIDAIKLEKEKVI
ncbi:MAG: restriction endonuclease subunit S [Candidatus Scalindua sp.]|nr:restriction endonuclease subunit S [Candidatus Scalindua sp.]